MDANTNFPPLFKTIGRIGLIVGILGIIGLLFTLATPEKFYEAYLCGWVLWMSLTLGCYGLMLLQNIVRASWGWPVIRMFEAGAKMMPLMGLAFLPIIFAAFNHQLYPWADPKIISTDEVVRYRSAYLNPTFFLLRNVIYFTVFTLFTWALTSLSRTQDRTGDLAYTHNRNNLAAPGFLIMVLLATFGITDWVMSLDKHWYSTIYGFWFVICSGLTAMAFVTLLSCLNKLRGVEPYKTLIVPSVTRDFGNLLLMMTMVWAYFSLSQFLITWSGNLPEEVSFYVKRSSGLLTYVGGFLIIFQFFVPFLLLLSGRTKRTPNYLALTAILILCVRVVDIGWNIIPMFHGLHAGYAIQPQEVAFALAAALGIGGLWLFGFFENLKRNALLPTSDLATLEVLEHAH